MDGKLCVQTVDSLLKATHILRDEGHEVVPYFLPGNIYLDNARNVCVHRFLESGCTDLIFIDSDVGFEPDAVSKLLVYGKDIIGGIYPLKQDGLEFPMKLHFDPVTNNCKEEETGLVYADMIPTGFMRIQRRVFDRMIEHYKMTKNHQDMYQFFAVGILFEGDNTSYGEDVYFCKRWREMGGELYIEPRLTFTHTGTKTWAGNLHEYLMGRSVQNIKDSFDRVDNGIPGWTTDGELQFIGGLASKSKSVVEIGSWKGRSTKVLLEMCPGKVFAVDHWKGSESDASHFIAEGKDIFSEFYGNVGHYPNLEICRGWSTEIAQTFNGNMVDMVFIDADHSYIGCKTDIAVWSPKARKYICGHDYDCPGVKRAVDEAFGKVNTVERVWWVDLGTQK